MAIRLKQNGLGLGRNPPCILDTVTERRENDLLTFAELDEIIKNHMQKGKKVV